MRRLFVSRSNTGRILRRNPALLNHHFFCFLGSKESAWNYFKRSDRGHKNVRKWHKFLNRMIREERIWFIQNASASTADQMLHDGTWKGMQSFWLAQLNHFLSMKGLPTVRTDISAEERNMGWPNLLTKLFAESSIGLKVID